jgi:hypothetical protein
MASLPLQEGNSAANLDPLTRYDAISLPLASLGHWTLSIIILQSTAFMLVVPTGSPFQSRCSTTPQSRNLEYA